MSCPPSVVAPTLVLAASLLAGCGAWTDPSPREGARGSGDVLPGCRVELWSWPVVGWGRHLMARIDCPEVLDGPPQIVEYCQAPLRFDYVAPDDPAFADRIVRALRRVGPPFGERRERREAVWAVSTEQAREILRPRLFSERYVLTGPNSNSGLHAVIQGAGLELPPHVVAGAGLIGSFPGIEMGPGEEIAESQWVAYGLSPPVDVDP